MGMTDPDDQVHVLADQNSMPGGLETTKADLEYSNRLRLFREKLKK